MATHSTRRFAVPAVIAAAALTLTACAPPGVSEDGGGESEKTTLTIAQSADFKSLDPHNLAETPAERVMPNIYSRLFVLDANDMTPVPDLVTEYEQVDDVTWEFQIRDDVTFHNGEELDAEDVAFSLNRPSDDETLLEYTHWKGISEVTATGDHTVQITTFEPMPTLLRTLSKSGGDIIPADLVEEIGIEEFITAPVGSGPYMIREWIRDDRIILDAYEDYYGGTPEWSEVVFRVIPEASTRVGELLTGGVDLVTDVPPVDWDRLETGDGVAVEFGETTRVMMLVLRTAEPWVTSDPRVREAIDLAIDNGLIADSLFKGQAVPVQSRVPNGVFGANPDLYDNYEVDVERARELVAEVGGGAPIPLHFTASNGRYPLDSEVAEMVVSMLTDVGFEVTVEILEGAAFSEAWGNKTQKDAVMIGLADGLLDAAYSLGHYEIGGELNVGRTDYNNPEVSDRIKEANSIMDQDRREQLYQEALAIVAEERPHVFLFQQPAAFGVSDAISFTPRLDDRIIFNDITAN